MKITIHRGTRQIGGCVTELQSGSSRIFVDFGSSLPDPDGTPNPDHILVPGLTDRTVPCSGLLFTHTHGDHVGNMGRVAEGVPMWMSEDGKKLMEIRYRHLQYAHDKYPQNYEDQHDILDRLETVNLFQNRQPFKLGEFRVTPIRVDHSAFDAYMFLIEAEGLRVLHTGDFRDHGFGGSELIPALKEIGTVDYLICEGTMLSRMDEKVKTEQELMEEARQLMNGRRHVFVLCSSTNIDRIRAFYQAKSYKCPAVCDGYQKKILDAAEESERGKNYQFNWVIPDSPKNEKLHNWMEDRGFLMFVRATDKFVKWMEPYKKDGLLIYSMWSGYRANPRIQKFLEGWDTVTLHTSGHAAKETLEKVIETVKPEKIIPIHTEKPEEFKNLNVGEAEILYLQDGEEKELIS